MPLRTPRTRTRLRRLAAPPRGWPAGAFRSGLSGWAAAAVLGLALPLLACETPPAPPPEASEAPAAPAGAFSGERAARDLKALSAAGSAAEVRTHVREALEAEGLPVELLTLEATVDGQAVTLEHLTVDVPGAEGARGRVILVAPLSRGLGPEAAPGTDLSGAAFLLEMARALAEDPLPTDVRLAFLEGEQEGGPQRWLGARSFARALAGDAQGVRDVRLLVYVDRLGAEGSPLARDRRSHRGSRDAFFEMARDQGAGALFPAAAAFTAPDAGHLAFRGAGFRRVVLLHVEPRPEPEPEPEGADAEAEAVEPASDAGEVAQSDAEQAAHPAMDAEQAADPAVDAERAATAATDAPTDATAGAAEPAQTATASPEAGLQSASRFAAVGEVVEATLRRQAAWWRRVDRMTGPDETETARSEDADEAPAEAVAPPESADAAVAPTGTPSGAPGPPSEATPSAVPEAGPDGAAGEGGGA